MSIICEIFGHKFIAAIYDSKWWSETYTRTWLDCPTCKRCGFKLEKIGVRR